MHGRCAGSSERYPRASIERRKQAPEQRSKAFTSEAKTVGAMFIRRALGQIRFGQW